MFGNDRCTEKGLKTGLDGVCCVQMIDVNVGWHKLCVNE